MLTIELEGALLATQAAPTPAKLTSPYRAPLTKFLNKYAADSIAYFLDPTRMLVRISSSSLNWRCEIFSRVHALLAADCPVQVRHQLCTFTRLTVCSLLLSFGYWTSDTCFMLLRLSALLHPAEPGILPALPGHPALAGGRAAAQSAAGLGGQACRPAAATRRR